MFSLAFTPGITGLCIDGVEYVPGEHRSIVGDCIGVILQGVSKDDGKFLDVFLHEPNELDLA